MILPSRKLILPWDEDYYDETRLALRQGMKIPRRGRGASAPTTLTFIASATADGNNNHPVVPATAAEGDVAVLFQYISAASAFTGSDLIPTDWLAIPNTFGSGADLHTYAYRHVYKVLTASDPGATVTTMNTGGVNAANARIIFVFRPDTPITSVIFSRDASNESLDWNKQVTSGDPASQFTEMTNLIYPGVFLGVAAAFGTVTFGTASPAFDAQVVGSSNDMRAGYKVYNSAAADHTVDIVDLGNSANHLASGYMRVV